MAFLLPFVGEENGIDLGNANNGREFELFIFAYWSLILVTAVDRGRSQALI